MRLRDIFVRHGATDDEWVNARIPKNIRYKPATLDDLIEVLRGEGVLVIERDENGEWAKWALDQAFAWNLIPNPKPEVMLDLLATRYNDPKRDA